MQTATPCKCIPKPTGLGKTPKYAALGTLLGRWREGANGLTYLEAIDLPERTGARPRSFQPNPGPCYFCSVSLLFCAPHRTHRTTFDWSLVSCLPDLRLHSIQLSAQGYTATLRVFVFPSARFQLLGWEGWQNGRHISITALAIKSPESSSHLFFFSCLVCLVRFIATPCPLRPDYALHV